MDAIHPIQVSPWTRQLLDGANELVTKGKKTTDKGESPAKGAELFQQIGKLQMELEWLKKSPSCSGARSGREGCQQCRSAAVREQALMPVKFPNPSWIVK